MGTLLLLLACAGNPEDSGGSPDDTSDTSAPDDTGETGEADDTGDTGEGPLLEVDVLVIGAGPAGLTAGWEALQSGASVLILERADHAGGSGWHGAGFFAAGSRFQEEIGIEDSPEVVRAEWEDLTGGGDPADPWVDLFIERSAGIVEWLVDDWGAELTGIGGLVDYGELPRIHIVEVGGWGPVGPLVDEMELYTWLEHEALSLSVDGDGRVVGAWAEDLATGEQFEIAAGATVVATGGFGRDLDRVRADRPELAGAQILFECAPTSDGGGHDLLDEVGAQQHNAGGMGLYVHAVEDWRAPGEAMVLLDIQNAVVVDRDGNRLLDEVQSASLDMAGVLADAPGSQVFAIYPGSFMDHTRAVPMNEFWDLEPGDELPMRELVDNGAAVLAEDAAAAADALGIDPDGLTATLERYNELVAGGEDLDFGKNPVYLVPFEEEVLGVELLPGAAKAYGGARLDLDARVLDPDDQPIPGLYAAGEVTGMLGTPAIGRGFTGTVTAVYLTGRIAGASAAAEAAGE